MSKRSDGRFVVSVTMQEHLYKELSEKCKDDDMPVSVFIRNLIKKELQS